MIALHGDLKILEATRPIDFRKGVNGLVALVAVALVGPVFRDHFCLQVEAE